MYLSLRTKGSACPFNANRIFANSLRGWSLACTCVLLLKWRFNDVVNYTLPRCNAQISRLFIQLLVLTSRSLTSLKLIQIPPTNAQTPLILIHALAEAINIIGTRARALLSTRVDSVLLRELGGLGGSLSRRGAAAAAEPASDCVADRGSDCYTAGGVLVRFHRDEMVWNGHL